MHIARHHIVGSTCLGTKEGHTILMRDRGKSKRGSDDNLRYFSKENRLKLLQNSQNVVLSKESASRGFEERVRLEEEFISVPKDDVKEEREGNVNPLGIYDAVTEQYLRGKGPVDDKDEPKSTKSFNVESHDGYVRRKTEYYNRKLGEEPNNIPLWLEFVQFQDEAITDSQSYERKKEEVEKRKKLDIALYEIKASILQKSLEKNPASVELKLAELEICKDYWDSDKVTAEWKDFVFKHPNDPIIWLQYLNFVQSQFRSFTVSGLLKVYAKCIQTLNQLREGKLTSHKAHLHTAEYMLGRLSITKSHSRSVYQSRLNTRLNGS